MRPTGFVSLFSALLLIGCDGRLPGDIEPFEVTVIVLGQGTGNGRVGEQEQLLGINCHIVAGRPSVVADIEPGNLCRDSFTDLNGGGSFLLLAVPDDGFEFVRWDGDCASTTGTICVVSFVSRDDITLTIRAQFRPSA